MVSLLGQTHIMNPSSQPAESAKEKWGRISEHGNVRKKMNFLEEETPLGRNVIIHKIYSFALHFTQLTLYDLLYHL